MLLKPVEVVNICVGSGGDADALDWEIIGLFVTTSRLFGFLTISALWCLFKASSLANERPQFWQGYGRSPVCNFWWRFRSC